jgi:hypothetical protein
MTLEGLPYRACRRVGPIHYLVVLRLPEAKLMSGDETVGSHQWEDTGGSILIHEEVFQVLKGE